MDIPSYIALARGVAELGGLLVNERDRQKAATIQIDFTNQLMELQSKLSEVLTAIIDKDGRIGHLSNRVRELESRQSDESRYQLAKLGTVGDFFAYKLRPRAELTDRIDEPEHFLCQPCFDAGKKGILRIIGSYCSCPICHSKTTLTPSATGIAVGHVVTARARDW